MTDKHALPLAGLTVVAIEQAVAAPLATRHLADWGARVIKIERPGTGDFARGYDTRVKGLSSYFVWLNRSKESLTLDLKRPEAAEVVAKLIASADIFVHNLAPGAMERLGFGNAAMRAQHPRLIICSVSGYGTSGPYRDRKAYDLLIQSEAGLALRYRYARVAGESGHFRRRYRRRHVRVFRHTHRACSPLDHR